MSTDSVWAEAIVKKIQATAEHVEDRGDVQESFWSTPWPTERGPFMLRGRWRRINGRIRMTSLIIEMVESADSFIPLTTTALRSLRLPEIDQQLLAEARNFSSDLLDDPWSMGDSQTRAAVMSARSALAEEPQPKRGPKPGKDAELLAAVAKAYDAAEGVQPVRATLRALRAESSPYRRRFEYTDATQAAVLAKVTRLVARARDLGLIKTPLLTQGRQKVVPSTEKTK